MNYYDKKKNREYVNWILRCPTHGGRCLKKRIVTADSTKRFGDIEPLAYVHSWISLLPPAGQTHSFQRPSAPVVAEYAKARRAELQELVDKWLVRL